MKLGTQVGPGPGHIVLDGDPAPLPPKGHRLPQFLAHICSGQMATWIKMSLGMKLGLGTGDFVLDGDPAPPPRKGGGASPRQIFGPCLLWPNGCMDEAGTWYGDRPQPRGLCVRWKPSPPPQQGSRAPLPKFSAHVYCGQMAGWIKMPLGTKVGLSPGDSVLDGDPAPSAQRGWGPLPNFRPISIVAKRLGA